MIGAIAGDVIGSRFESQDLDKIPYDFDLFQESSQALTFADINKFTDDTVLTFAVYDSIRNEKDIDSCLRDWANRYPNRGYGMRFYHWVVNEHLGPYGSYGNGSAMRISCIPYLFDNRKDMLSCVENVSNPTHNHPEGIKGAKAIADCIWFSLKGKSKDFIQGHVETEYEYSLTLDHEELVENNKELDYTCQKTVPVSISCFLMSDDFIDSIRKSVMVKGDTDTMAAMTGSISEAYYNSIPKNVLQKTISYLSPEMKNMYSDFINIV